jgi:hypothetical protein
VIEKLNQPSDRSPIRELTASLTTRTPLTRGKNGHFREWIAIPLFSVALLIPCFWQSRIQAADLSSHVYNAWLASQVRQGAAPGLWIEPQSTNVLFDLFLEWLFTRVGPNFAQRIAVSVSVLVFGWGAILFIFRAGGRNWWFAFPCVAMLAYSFIFHMGFFNFYLSLGLCLWYLGVFWGRSWQIRALAMPLLIIAWVAHPFPVVWALGTAVYLAFADYVQPRRRFLLMACGVAALILLRYIISQRYPYSWSVDQLTFITGANQIALFGLKYVPLFACLLLIWALLLRDVIKHLGAAHLFATIPFQLWLLNAAAVALIPDRLLLPGFGRPLGYIAQRLSLSSGLLMCAVLAAVPMTRATKVALASVAILFFALLYTDDRELNRLEDRMDLVVNQLPRGQRVVTYLHDQSLRSLVIYHNLDRACIGHCYSYANYEPSSKQFRVHAGPGNGIVLDKYADVDAVAAGSYVVQPRDLPLYLIYPCGVDFHDVCSHPLGAGEINGKPN